MIMIKCKKCEKEIEGYNTKQVEYLLAQHTLAKHKTKGKKYVLSRMSKMQ